VTAKDPEYDLTAADGVRHRVWVMSDETMIAQVVKGFADLGPIYIADGHHRSAAASRVAAARKSNGAATQEADRFLAVSFPASQMKILPYNRVVKDLNGLGPDEFLKAVKAVFDVVEGKPEPIKPKQFGMYLGSQWYTLSARDGSYDAKDPTDRLDVSILQKQLLQPILGIEDPRRDKRVEFVGGIRGDGELEKRVKEGAAVAFNLHATSIEELFAIADAEQVMPPKSTWFEPKLRDGLTVHTL